MLVQVFDDIEALRSVHSARAEPARAIFQSLDWFEHLARHGMPPGIRLDLVCTTPSANDPAAPPTCLPLIRTPRGLASLSNFYSGLYGPTGGEGSTEGWLAVCRHLRTIRPRPAQIKLQPLDAEGGFYAKVRDALAAAGYWTDSYFCFGNWYHRTDGCRFEDYLAARPSAVRNTVRRGRQKLDKAGNWQVSIHTQPGASLDEAISAYEAIYARSWKPAEAYPNFIRGLCQMAARNGWLRLGVLALEGHAMASQLWLFSAGTAYIFKLAYDPAAARFSPGSVLTAAMMEHAIDQDGAEEIDYLSGDDAYKQDWMSQRRERLGLVAFDPAAMHGLLGALRHFGGRGLRSIWQRRPA